MASYFNLTLDTVGPQNVAITLAGGAARTSTASVVLATTTDDSSTTGYQMKIWGDVDGATTEAAATWETFVASKTITLSTGDGSKSVKVKLRDDVYNESTAAVASIILDSSVPVVTTTSGPDYSKISKITGKDTCTFAWQCDSDGIEYKVCVVPATTSIQSAGTTIPTAGGSTGTSGSSVTASTEMTTVIKGTDLETAAGSDGVKIIKVFVKNATGTWSV